MLFYLYTFFIWGDLELFTRSIIPPLFDGIVVTSRFVNSLFFLWLECSLSDIYAISFNFHTPISLRNGEI